MKPEFDILMIGEGTYPYVRGGVSSWIHQIINGMPDIKFGIVFMGSVKSDYGEMRYELPKNVVYMKKFYMFEKQDLPDVRRIKLKNQFYNDIENIHSFFREGLDTEVFTKSLIELISEFPIEYLLYSDTAWNFITDRYKNSFEDEAFIDFFWTIRNMHLPLWVIFNELKDIKLPKLIHTPSTGYAGFLGGLLKAQTGIPLILTEHGIYVRERKIDLLTSDIYTPRLPEIVKPDGGDAIKELWNRFFISLGKFCYDMSDKIYSLYSKAREIQIAYGAEAEKCTVIPNGVNVQKLGATLKNRPEGIPKVIGLVGRVVPIKDIKTFIKAMKIVADKLPEAEGWVVGPTEEDPVYFEECQNLVKILGIEKNIKFLGFQNLVDIFPQLGINTLTSISEGMPLSVLEAFAAGVPAVSTDVGACKDLIYGGLNAEDEAIGKAGFICKVADTQDIADKYIQLLTNEELWDSCQKAGLERVNRFYTQEIFLQNYRDVYEEFI